MFRRTFLLLWCTVSLSFAPAQAQFFEYLSPSTGAFVNSLSGDGKTVGGRLRTPESFGEPAIWTIMDGWVRLFPGAEGGANAISDDGSVVVGRVNDSAFVYFGVNGSRRLFPSPSNAWALDGSGTRFILWRNSAALYDLITDTDVKFWPSSGTGSTYTITPTRISHDGSTVIGEVSGRGRTETGFVERIGGAYIPLPRGAYPQAVSRDGSLVAGAFWDATTSRWEVFLWSESTGMTILPRLPVTPQTQGRTMPSIGGVWRGPEEVPQIAGSWRVPDNDPEAGWQLSEGELYAAVIWTDPAQPPQYLRTYLRSLRPFGAPIAPLGQVVDVSVDGNVMVGTSFAGPWRAAVRTTSAQTPTPELFQLSPSNVIAGGEGFTLLVEGRGFRPNAQVQWDGYLLPTRYHSPTRLEADVPASAIVSPGTVPVLVLNPHVPPPGGRRSTTLDVTIGERRSPEISLMSPTGVRAGSTGVRLRVQGRHFTSQSQIRFSGTLLTTTFVSSSELRAELPEHLLSTPAIYTVQVYEPSVNDDSNSLQFVVTPAIPTITRLTPNSTVQNPPSILIIRVTGSGFESGAQVYFQSTALPTTYVSSSELRATVAQGLVTTPGTYFVSVYNPGSGMYSPSSGWFSNNTAFRVLPRRTNPPPPPPNTELGGSPSLRMTDAHIVPNVVSQVFVTIQNGGGPLTGGRLTSATLSGLPTVLLSDPGLSQLGAGESAQLIFGFLTPNIRSGQSFVVVVTGTSDQGAWSASRIVTVP